MSGAALALPFLAAMKKLIPQDMSAQVQAPSAIPQQDSGDAIPPPNLSAGQPQAPPPDPVGDLTQSMTQGQAVPKFQETKGHMLMRLLQSGLQGGLNGMAANAQTYAQTGRNAGFGGGFAGAQQMPFLQAQRGQQLQMGQAQIDLLKQQAQMVNVPGIGQMPASLAKVIFPQIVKGQYGQTIQGMKGQTAENVANIQKRYIPVPGVGLFDSQSRQVLPGTENGITITPEIAKDHDLPQEFIGKPMSLQQLASVQRSDVFQNTPQMTAQGPIVVNRKTAKATPVTGPGGQTYSPPALASPREVADDENPGQTKIVSGGTAIATGAAGPNSASVVVPRTAAKAEVPTKIGDQRVAFTTMVQHADLLRRAAKALNNGDVQTLSGLENAFKNEFGYSGPITSAAIADAYKGEVSNVINKGHITDTGNERIAHTLDPTHQNYATIDSVLGAYQALAQSKMNMLNQQEQSAISKSQPTKPNNKNHKDPLGIR